MRPKTRGLAQHGGPPGWLGESDPAGVILNVVWTGGRTACLFRTVPVAQKGAAQLLADGIYRCCYFANVHSCPSCATSHKEGMAWHYTVVDQFLLSDLIRSRLLVALFYSIFWWEGSNET